MKFIFPGLIAGIMLNFLTLMPEGGIQLLEAWYGKVSEISSIEPMQKSASTSGVFFSVKTQGTLYALNMSGSIHAYKNLKKLSAFSRSGRYYVTFTKVGKSIEFFNIKGERFWKMKSREYPYLSYNSDLILLMVGDHSRIRIASKHGKQIGIAEVSGRTATVIRFAPKRPVAGVGFLDGRYYIINSKGGIVFSGQLKGAIIKGIAVSDNARFACIHYGEAKQDRLLILGREKHRASVTLRDVHLSKTALHIDNRGRTTVLESSRIDYFNKSGNKIFSVIIPRKREGTADIVSNRDFIAVSYTLKKGQGKLIILSRDGYQFFSRVYPGDSFLKLQFNKNYLFLRGSHNLYCYNFDYPDNQ